MGPRNSQVTCWGGVQRNRPIPPPQPSCPLAGFEHTLPVVTVLFSVQLVPARAQIAARALIKADTSIMWVQGEPELPSLAWLITGRSIPTVCPES